MNARAAVVGALLLVAPSGAARADFADAVRAYDGGDYATAFAEWLRLARAGDADGQAALAGMYRFGEGRPVDLAESARWYRRAARQGNAIAQLNLGEMYMLGLGVRRDAVTAHVWLDLAARQGNGWAAAQRDALARAMTAAQRREAARRARAFSPQPAARP